MPAGWPRRPASASTRTGPTPTWCWGRCWSGQGSTPATAGWSPSWSTAPPACAGPATGWSTGSSRSRPSTPTARATLRLGAYQVVFLGLPPHAAVTTAVDVAPTRSRGLVNAVLRKVAADREAHGRWPGPGHRPELPRLDHGAAHRRPGGGARPRSDGGHEHVGGPDHPRRRLHPGPGLAVGGGAGRRRGGRPGRRPVRRAGRQGHRPGRHRGLGGRRRPPTRSGRPGGRERDPHRHRRRPGDSRGADGTRPPFRPEAFDRVLRRRPLLRAGRAAPPGGCPLAGAARRR